MLKSKGLWEDTVVIFMADHGEYLGERDIWGHSPPGYKQVIHVPLIVVCPQKFPMNREVLLPVQLVDLMPTILELAGIRVDRLLLSGDSLVPLLRGEAPEFWNERISISEEVRAKTKDGGASCGSILWRNFHILTSDVINDIFARKMQGFLTDTRKKKVSTRIFPLFENGDENRISGVCAFDIWLQHKMARFFKEFRRQNMMIWSILTEFSEEEAGFDEKSIQQLRSLGYIE